MHCSSSSNNMCSTSIVVVAVTTLAICCSGGQSLCLDDYSIIEIPPDSLSCNPYAGNKLLELGCTVTPYENVEIQWYFSTLAGDTRVLTNDSLYTITNTYIDNQNMLILSSTLTLNLTSAEDSIGYYRCVVSIPGTGNMLVPAMGSMSYRTYTNGTRLANEAHYASVSNDCSYLNLRLVYDCTETMKAPIINTSSSAILPTKTAVLSSASSIVSTTAAITSSHIINSSSSAILPTNTTMLSSASSIVSTATATTTSSHIISSSRLPPATVISPITPTPTTSNTPSSPSVSLSKPMTATSSTSQTISTSSLEAPTSSVGPANELLILLVLLVFVLVFLLSIVTVLIVSIVCCNCYKKSRNRQRCLPPTLEEIGIRRRRWSSDRPRPISSSDAESAQTNSTQSSALKSYTIVQQLPSNSTHRMSLQGFSFRLSSSDNLEDIYAIPQTTSAEDQSTEAQTALNHYVNIGEQAPSGSQDSCNVIENIYDVPNVPNAGGLPLDCTIETCTSSTYTLPDDARRFAPCPADASSSGSNTSSTTTTDTTSSSRTRGSWFDQQSPCFIAQQSHLREGLAPATDDIPVAKFPSLSSLSFVLGDHGGCRTGFSTGSSLPDLSDCSGSSCRMIVQQLEQSPDSRFWIQSLAHQSFKLPFNHLPSISDTDRDDSSISPSSTHSYTNLHCALSLQRAQMDTATFNNLSSNTNCKALAVVSRAATDPLRSSSSSGCSDLSKDSRELAEPLYGTHNPIQRGPVYQDDKEASVGYNTASPSDEVYSPLGDLHWYQSSELVQTGYKSLNDLTKEPVSMYTVPTRTPQRC